MCGDPDLVRILPRGTAECQIIWSLDPVITPDVLDCKSNKACHVTYSCFQVRHVLYHCGRGYKPAAVHGPELAAQHLYRRYAAITYCFNHSHEFLMATANMADH